MSANLHLVGKDLSGAGYDENHISDLTKEHADRLPTIFLGTLKSVFI